MNFDPILYWNDVAMEVHRRDFTTNKDGDASVQGPINPDQGGPTRVSRAFAIVHIAMYSAYEVVEGGLQRYTGIVAPGAPTGHASAAVTGAAVCTLTSLFPHPALRSYVAQKAREYLAAIASAHAVNGSTAPAVSPAAINQGLITGDNIGMQVLALRNNDGSANPGWYVPALGPGHHREDPFQPGQGHLGARWGRVTKFAIPQANNHSHYLGAPPAMGTAAYKADVEQVRYKGLGRNTPGTEPQNAMARTAEETVIGIFWGYDGARGLGVPPRLYNQCARAVIDQHAAAKNLNTTRDHARLFALLHSAMADSGIIAWDAKYHYNLWRPVLGVREHDAGFGPGHGSAAPAALKGDPCWAPLGAPQTNTAGKFNATPPFPAYPSGHATFGAACFEVLKLVYQGSGPDLSFQFVSDEFDGKNLDADGSVRTLHSRSLSLDQAIEENSISRVYLGVHWKFDGFNGSNFRTATKGGVPAGLKIAAETVAAQFKKVPGP